MKQTVTRKKDVYEYYIRIVKNIGENRKFDSIDSMNFWLPL